MVGNYGDLGEFYTVIFKSQYFSGPLSLDCDLHKYFLAFLTFIGETGQPEGDRVGALYFHQVG